MAGHRSFRNLRDELQESVSTYSYSHSLGKDKHWIRTGTDAGGIEFAGSKDDAHHYIAKMNVKAKQNKTKQNAKAASHEKLEESENLYAYGGPKHYSYGQKHSITRDGEHSHYFQGSKEEAHHYVAKLNVAAKTKQIKDKAFVSGLNDWKNKNLTSVVHEAVDVGSSDSGSVGFNVGPLGAQPAVDDLDVTVTDLGNGITLQRLNAYVGSIASRDYIDPRNALQTLQRKLALIGLLFDIPKFWAPIDHANGQRTDSYSLKMFGGRYGFVDMDGVVKSDDGITPKLGHGLNLEVTYKLNPNGTVCPYARIVPSSSGEVKTIVQESKNPYDRTGTTHEKQWEKGFGAAVRGHDIHANPHDPIDREYHAWAKGHAAGTKHKEKKSSRIQETSLEESTEYPRHLKGEYSYGGPVEGKENHHWINNTMPTAVTHPKNPRGDHYFKGSKEEAHQHVASLNAKLKQDRVKWKAKNYHESLEENARNHSDHPYSDHWNYSDHFRAGFDANSQEGLSQNDNPHKQSVPDHGFHASGASNAHHDWKKGHEAASHYRKGYTARFDGKSINDNPHDKGNENHVHWKKGYKGAVDDGH